MIPDDKKCRELWDKYHVPENKRRHMELVAIVAIRIARLLVHGSQFTVNTELLYAAGMLHDLDKNIPKLPGEAHPDTAVRILRQEGMDEVASLIKYHSLHFILDPKTSPKSWEEKILFLSDKMVKYEVIGVDRRFKLWINENLPAPLQLILDKSYPLVKKLERDMFSYTSLTLEQLKAVVQNIS